MYVHIPHPLTILMHWIFVTSDINFTMKAMENQRKISMRNDMIRLARSVWEILKEGREDNPGEKQTT